MPPKIGHRHLNSSKRISKDRTYQVEIDDKSYELIVKDATVVLNGKEIAAELHEIESDTFILSIGDRKIEVFGGRTSSGIIALSLNNHNREIDVKDESEILLEKFRNESDSDSGIQAVHAPMPGLVLKILVKAGDQVEKGDGLLILEAMKMENEIKAAQNAQVNEVLVEDAQAVSKGEKMIVLHLDS